MVTITPKARDKFKSILDTQNPKTDDTIRMVQPEENPQQMSLVIDKPKEGDVVFNSANGKPILVLDQNLAKNLETSTIDYNDDSKNTGFRITIEHSQNAQ